MIVDYINPFIEASIEVLSKMANTKLKKGTAYQKKSGFESDNIAIVVGIVGKLKGQVIYTMKEQSAIYIASVMQSGTYVEKLDEMSKSAISELANIISGNAMTIFSGRNLKMEISPPTLLIGSSLSISVSKNVIISIPMIFSNGLSFEINVVLA